MNRRTMTIMLVVAAAAAIYFYMQSRKSADMADEVAV